MTETNAMALRRLMAEHGLTYADVAELSGRTVKAVERWLARDGALTQSPMPDNALRLVRLSLKHKRPRARKA